MDHEKIVAVVVAYNPDLERLDQQFKALLPQVASVVVVDNGTGHVLISWIRKWFPDRVHYISLNGNKGIGLAQNIGIKKAKALEATHVLLMDHDSVPDQYMVRCLRDAILGLPLVGAVGPFHYDGRRQPTRSPFVRRVGLSMRRVRCDEHQNQVEVDHLIASGCLVPMHIFDNCGTLREDFFIDFVDIEWSLRVQRGGYRLYGVCSARLEHRIGHDPVFFLGRDYVSHPPERYYYHVRNAILVFRLRWVSVAWKVASAWRLLLRTGFYLVVPPRRFEYLKYAVHGFIDGVLGRSGKYTDR